MKGFVLGQKVWTKKFMYFFYFKPKKSRDKENGG